MDSQCKTLSMLQVPLVGHDVSNDEPAVCVPVTGRFSPIPVQTLGCFRPFLFSVRSVRSMLFWLEFRGGSFRPNIDGSSRPFYFLYFFRQ